MSKNKVKNIFTSPILALVMNYTVMTIALLVLAFMLSAMITMFHFMLVVYAVISAVAFYFSYQANKDVRWMIADLKSKERQWFDEE